MKKQMRDYIISWAALVGLFHIVCFVTPDEIGGVSKFAGAFWSGYGFTVAAFVIHLVYAVFAFSEENGEKRILHMPLTVISFAELALMVAAGLVCLLIPAIPNWVGIILCYTVFVLSVVFLLAARNAGENAWTANQDLNARTGCFRELTDMAQEMTAGAKDSGKKGIAQRVYDAIRYSDPVSAVETEEEEREIRAGLAALSAAVTGNGSMDEVRSGAEELLERLAKRNNRCKALKRQKV